ncbi:phosphatase 2C-like domain-containing protein [Pavlovales sp. CCMP2436]|nr:phosphatase 2C-like domain-containing protein [Pavlovales sp. CCMP2436]
MRHGETSAKINQDRGAVCYPFADSERIVMFSVFDGHGVNGDKVSHFVMNTLQAILEDHPLLLEKTGQALKHSYLQCDSLLKQEPTIDSELSGTTAVVAVMIENKLIVANAGDSRAVLARRTASGQIVAVDLSEDQKPDTPAEMARITKKKGFVSPPEEEWGGPARVWLDANMTLPGLAMARSIGDHMVTAIGVIAEPEILEFDILPEDLFFIVASDGVWEFISSEEAVALCAPIVERSGATEACTKLIEKAASKWREEEGDYRDDITAIVCKLPCLPSRTL